MNRSLISMKYRKRHEYNLVTASECRRKKTMLIAGGDAVRDAETLRVAWPVGLRIIARSTVATMMSYFP
jgi:hypothetical protein